MATTDIRKTLPEGVNAVDMNDRGERSGPVDIYGNAYEARSCYAAMRAWGVVAHHLLNPVPEYKQWPGMTEEQKTPNPTREGGPTFMLKFADGKWRYASFRGISGPPWFRVAWEGVEAPNGEAAYLMQQLESAVERRKNLEAEVAAQANRVAELKAQLAEAMKKPKQ